jgi:hypothetical protein
MRLGLAATLAAGAAGAAEEPRDKSQYTLFNPTPVGLMRDFNPDRPDATGSPYTVDAGHYQWEMDFFNLTLNHAAGSSTRTWQLGDFNFRAGLLNNAEVQLDYGSYLNTRSTDPSGHPTTLSGLGDITVRLKVNLWGDDSGETAFALVPYVKFPTNTHGLGNNAVEGGLILPLAVNLPYDFCLSTEIAAGAVKNDDDDQYHGEFIYSASVDHPIAGKLSGFLEFFSDFSTVRHAGWIGTVDTGFQYLLTKNIQLDADCFFGVTRAAPDFNPFAGITIRF